LFYLRVTRAQGPMRSVGPVQGLRWISSFKLHIYVLLLCASIVACDDRVRLEDVTTLTLVKGQMTAGRRSAPVPQLQCIGGSAKGRYEPRVSSSFS
uniref:Store-operated calcium entry-associated regulatory factor n=1 Tax=Anisakis simplex TaxID=6269 RepID=A0A0M3J4C6_ANISI